MAKKLFFLNFLHILNDGFKVSLLLFLPFIAQEFGISLSQVGFLGSTVNIFEIICAIPAGILAARFGGYKVLLGGLFAYTIGFFLVGFSPSFWTIIPAFIFAGIGFGLFHPVSFSLISKLVDKSERGRRLGDFTAVGDIGRIGIAAIITFIITYIGWRYTAFGAFLLLLVTLAVCIWMFKKNGKVESEHHDKPDISYIELLKNKRFVLVSITYLVDCFASHSLFIFIPFLLLHRGVEPKFLGILTATFFIGNMMGKAVLGRLVDTYGSVRVFMLSEGAMAVFMIVISQSISIPVIAISSVVVGLFTKGTMPILTAMVSESVEHHGRFEKAFSLNAVFAGVGTGLSPFVFGVFADHWGIESVFMLSAILALIAIIPAYMFKMQKAHLH